MIKVVLVLPASMNAPGQKRMQAPCDRRQAQCTQQKRRSQRLDKCRPASRWRTPKHHRIANNPCIRWRKPHGGSHPGAKAPKIQTKPHHGDGCCSDAPIECRRERLCQVLRIVDRQLPEFSEPALQHDDGDYTNDEREERHEDGLPSLLRVCALNFHGRLRPKLLFFAFVRY